MNSQPSFIPVAVAMWEMGCKLHRSLLEVGEALRWSEIFAARDAVYFSMFSCVCQLTPFVFQGKLFVGFKGP